MAGCNLSICFSRRKKSIVQAIIMVQEDLQEQLQTMRDELTQLEVDLSSRDTEAADLSRKLAHARTKLGDPAAVPPANGHAQATLPGGMRARLGKSSLVSFSSAHSVTLLVGRIVKLTIAWGEHPADMATEYCEVQTMPSTCLGEGVSHVLGMLRLLSASSDIAGKSDELMVGGQDTVEQDHAPPQQSAEGPPDNEQSGTESTKKSTTQPGGQFWPLTSIHIGALLRQLLSMQQRAKVSLQEC